MKKEIGEIMDEISSFFIKYKNAGFLVAGSVIGYFILKRLFSLIILPFLVIVTLYGLSDIVPKLSFLNKLSWVTVFSLWVVFFYIVQKLFFFFFEKK